MFNTLHTLCFMHGLSIYEIKMICHRLISTELHLSVFSAETISSDKMSIDI